MNYKVAIDPGNGGTDSGYTGNGIVEKDYNLLISNYIKERLDALGIPNIITRNTDRTVTDEERVNIITSAFGNDSNVIVLSNNLNNGGETGFEVVYALKDNDALAKRISDQVEAAGFPVNKYYQLRDPNNTAQDYYSIIRGFPNYKPVSVFYGYVDNSADANRIKNSYIDYAEAVVKGIADFIGVSYVPVGDNTYVVKKGDSLYAISRNFGISVDELKRANNLTSNLLNIGQILVIPKGSSTPAVPGGNTYTVKKGDTLYGIATRYGISVNDLKNANNLTSNTLSIGQVIVIPGSNIYTVKSGDTLYSIARNNNVTVDAIKRANNLSSNLLSVGQKLIIP